jgi:hypothetical protein
MLTNSKNRYSQLAFQTYYPNELSLLDYFYSILFQQLYYITLFLEHIVC